MMKSLLIFITLLCLATAGFHSVIRHEVQQLVASDPSLTVDTCTERCDDLLALVVEEDENRSDQLCAQECSKAFMSTTPKQHHHHHQDTTTSTIL